MSITKRTVPVIITIIVIFSLAVYALAQPPSGTTPSPQSSATPTNSPSSISEPTVTPSQTNNPTPTQTSTSPTPTVPLTPTATPIPPTAMPSLAPTATPAPTVASGTMATFNFDNDLTNLYLRQPTPVIQANSGITAQFTSATIPASAFSIQSQSTTQFVLSKTSGNYLEHSYAGRNNLDITFSQPIKSITLTFATIDYHDPAAGNPTPMTLTAYSNAAKTTTVGTPVTISGSFISGDTYPQGTITLTSTTPFSTVELQMEYLTQGAVDFIVDNVIVTAA